MYGTIYSGKPADVLDTTPQMAPGTIVWTADGKAYKYVKLGTEASVVAVKGAAVYYTDKATCYTITSDESDGIAVTLGGGCAGVWIRSTTTAALQGFDSAHYAFIQVGGVAACQGGGSVAAGDAVYAGNTDGVFVSAAEADSAAKYKKVIGVALEDDTATTGAGGALALAAGGADAIVAFYCKLTGLI